MLGCDWGLSQIEKIINLKIRVDFEQGLDARIIANNRDIAKLLSRVKWYKPIRMACDTKAQMDYVEKATHLLRRFGAKPSVFFVYVLLKDDIQDALERVMFLKRLKLDPYVQPFRSAEKDSYLNAISMDFARWVNKKPVFKTCSWRDYRARKTDLISPAKRSTRRTR